MLSETLLKGSFCQSNIVFPCFVIIGGYLCVVLPLIEYYIQCKAKNIPFFMFSNAVELCKTNSMKCLYKTVNTLQLLKDFLLTFLVQYGSLEIFGLLTPELYV